MSLFQAVATVAACAIAVTSRLYLKQEQGNLVFF